VFLNFLGIPTVGLQFNGPYGVYHSMYDDFYWTNHFGDPEYRYHTLMTQLWGTLALRLGNAEVIPYDFAFYGRNIREFVDELDHKNRVSAHVDLRNLRARITAFENAGSDFNAAAVSALGRAAGSGASASDGIDRAAAIRVNAALMQVERNWCNPAGIPGRPWFKHTLYAARFTYAHLELPGLTEAAEAGDWRRVTQQAKILDEELAKNTSVLIKAREDLGGAKPQKGKP
jgi:N-acetylated-alpha-linked acidic dipeptidase